MCDEACGAHSEMLAYVQLIRYELERGQKSHRGATKRGYCQDELSSSLGYYGLIIMQHF